MTEEDVKLNYITPAIEKSGWKKSQIKMEYSINDGKIEVENNYAKINSFFNRSYFYDKKLIKDYSGGNRQLIGLMAAFIVNSPVIILDEPFNFLDTKTAEAFCDFMNSYRIERHAVILFTSNSNNFFGLKDINFLNIKDGKIYE